MTQEQKAKAYDEVLERAQKATQAGSDVAMDIVQYIFPELTESKDERIRKAIRCYVEDMPDTYGFAHGIGKADMLAWLEKQKEPEKEFHIPPNFGMAHYNPAPIKQKEQKPNIELIQRSWYMEGYHDREFGKEPKWIVKTGEGGPKHELNPKYGEYIEKEQKPTPDWMPKFLDELRSKKNYFDWDEHRDIEGHILAIINWIAPNYFKRKEEQKPAEKQDYSGLNDFERAIHRGFLVAGMENVPVTIIKETAQDCLAHIPAEWSKEDEMYLSQAVETLEHENYSILADKLKSLRPSWKPSEEQMKALEKAIVRSCSHQYGVPLSDLYEQLKKL